jgi:hypothetical protein
MADFTGTVRSTQAETVTDWFNYGTAADAPGFWSDKCLPGTVGVSVRHRHATSRRLRRPRRMTSRRAERARGGI